MPAPDVVSIVGEIASFVAMTKAEEEIASFLAMTYERAMTLVGYNGGGMDVPS